MCSRTGSCTRSASGCCSSTSRTATSPAAGEWPPQAATSAPAASTSTAAVPLAAKLATFDAAAELAYVWLREYLYDDGVRDRLIELARSRHILGHARYGDGGLFEYSRDRLVTEIDEELADAIVYAVRRLSL